MKKGLLLVAVFLSGCWGFQQGSLDDADLFNWENESVTMAQFVRDHKKCLGAPDRPTQQNRLQKFLLPQKPYTIPKWDGLWATFESRQYGETGQRISLSVPSGTGYAAPSSYRRCMMRKEYYLLGYN